MSTLLASSRRISKDPPEIVLPLVEAWREGANVVFGPRRMREDSRWRILISRTFEALLRRFAMPKESKFYSGRFLLMDRKVVERVRQMREANRLIFGLVVWTGLRQTIVAYDRQSRAAGRSSWSVGRMVKSIYDGRIGFSGAIPRAMTLLGTISSLVGFIAALYFQLHAVLLSPLPGWSTIMMVLSSYFGIVFMILGTICKYLLRIYVESTRRPLYFIAADTADNDRRRGDRQLDRNRRVIHA